MSDVVSEQELQALRLRIDSLDEKILALISDRASCAEEVARVKMKALPEGEKPVFYRPEREAQVLKRIMERNKGPLGNEEMARLFREIMSSCLALENPLKVAYLGPEGTFSQAAAMKHFGHAVISVPMAAIDEVFREVAAGAVNFGVVPVENSTEGAINHTLDSFLEHDMVICGEVELRIHHHLLVGETTKTDKITRIYSHAGAGKYAQQLMPVPSVNRVAQGVEVVAKYVQRAQYCLAIGEKDVMPHDWITAGDAREITKAAGSVTKYLQVLTALGQ